MSIALRDYQLEAINAVKVSFREGVNRQLISLPTGSGKTSVMASLAMQLNKKTILLAHREELITQAIDKFKLIWPTVDIGICMACKDEINAQVVVASIQSASRPKRLARLQERFQSRPPSCYSVSLQFLWLCHGDSCDDIADSSRRRLPAA